MKINQQVLDDVRLATMRSREKANEILKQAKLEYAKTIKALLKEVLDVTAEHNLLSIITVIGHTPSFNDGDPCTHQTSIYINIGDHLDENIDLSVLGPWVDEMSDEGCYEEYRVLCRENGYPAFDNPHKLTDILARLLGEVAEEMHGTNFAWKIIFKDGEIIESVDEYNEY